MNVEHDVKTVGVQTIMLVEDSVRFYSSVLPLLYKFVLYESKEFSKEALNDHLRMLRMRGRPKILLARNYEEAVSYYKKYGDNMLGVITDMSFSVGERKTGWEVNAWLSGSEQKIVIFQLSTHLPNRKTLNMLVKRMRCLSIKTPKLFRRISARLSKRTWVSEILLLHLQTKKRRFSASRILRSCR